MTHTLHEQHKTITSNEELGIILQNELGFIKDGDSFFIGEKGHDPYMNAPANMNAHICFYNGVIAINNITKVSAASSEFYWHSSSDMSVRYIFDNQGNTPVIWAQDINGGWSAITSNNFIAPDKTVNITNIYTHSNINAVVNAGNTYTITKIARSDNGVPFKGLYMVTSARSFFFNDTLINIDGDIFRLTSNYKSGASAYPMFAFKVSD